LDGPTKVPYTIYSVQLRRAFSAVGMEKVMRLWQVLDFCSLERAAAILKGKRSRTRKLPGEIQPLCRCLTWLPKHPASIHELSAICYTGRVSSLYIRCSDVMNSGEQHDVTAPYVRIKTKLFLCNRLLKLMYGCGMLRQPCETPAQWLNLARELPRAAPFAL